MPEKHFNENDDEKKNQNEEGYINGSICAFVRSFRFSSFYFYPFSIIT